MPASKHVEIEEGSTSLCRREAMVGLAALGGCALVPSHYGKTADLVLINGKVATLDARNRFAEAVAIAGGRITDVGSTLEILAAHRGSVTVVRDLGGATVIPGIIDNHLHFARGAEYWREDVRFESVTSRAEAVGRLRERAASLAPEDWLLSLGGWSEEQFRDSSAPFNRAELDQIGGGRPTFLQVGYSHAYASTAALKAAGIKQRSPALADDPVERNPDGELTGLVRGTAGQQLIRRAMPRVVNRADGVRAFASALNALGVTTVFDAGGIGVNDETYAGIVQLQRRSALGQSRQDALA